MPWGERDRAPLLAEGPTFRRRLIGLRRYLGVPDEDLAGALGVTRMTLWRWINGANLPGTLERCQDLSADLAVLYRVMARRDWPRADTMDARSGKRAAEQKRRKLFRDALADSGWAPTWNTPKRRSNSARDRAISGAPVPRAGAA